MKCSSRVIMGATIAMVAILAFVLTLVLLLLAELYCSLLLRRPKLKPTRPDSNPENSSISDAQAHHSLPSPLSTFYAQGVLDAPRSFLFPKLPGKRKEETRNVQINQIHGKLHQFLRIHSPNQLGLRSPSSSPSPTYISLTKPPKSSQTSPKPEIEVEVEVEVRGCDDEASSNNGGGENREDLMYISNPIYDNDVARPSQVDTPFETPGSSPTWLDRNGSSGETEMQMAGAPSSPPSLPLTPMKELPPKACSVELKNARSSLGASGTGSESNHSHIGRTSSSSGSPWTSPSW